VHGEHRRVVLPEGDGPTSARFQRVHHHTEPAVSRLLSVDPLGSDGEWYPEVLSAMLRVRDAQDRFAEAVAWSTAEASTEASAALAAALVAMGAVARAVGD
jgi:hypothetical protein